jgi:mRNA-degrading endonuclease toxin of MazEF toxin-antitoxin module
VRKDYKKWMQIKALVNNRANFPRGYKEREIWICNVGDNVGMEEDGKNGDYSRPVLILKIYNREFCHIIPLSTTNRRGKFYYQFDGGTGKTSVALLSQSRAISSARLHDKIGSASVKDFSEIRRRLIDLLFGK